MIRTVDVLILGGGPAGLTAGIYAARAGAKTLLVENLACGGQINLTPDILNFPGFMEIGGADLGERIREQAEHAGVEIIYDEIKKIDTGSDKIEFETETVKYKSLIIATGGSPRRLGVPREDDFIGGGIHFCGLCDGAFYGGKNIVVVGGGNHAVEEAIYLSNIASSVTLVTNTPKLTAQDALVKQLSPKIAIHYSSGITELCGEKKLSGVKLDNGKTIDCDGVFVAIGRTPNSAPFAGLVEMTKDGWIIVDSDMRTSRKNVFAAGDVVQKSVKQVVTACADGAIAATFATKI